MALAISFISGRAGGGAASLSFTLGSLLLILSGAAAVLICERETGSSAVFEPGVPRRILTLCMSAPFYLIIPKLLQLTGSRDEHGTALALIASTAFVRWGERTKVARDERISLGLAFTAGLCGLVLAAITSGDKLLTAGALAAMSLAVNAASPFMPPVRPRSGGGGAARVVPGAAPPAGEGGKAGSPAAPLPPELSAASRAARGPLSLGARTFWLAFSALFLGSFLSLVIYTALVLRQPHEVALGVSFAWVSLGYFTFSSRVGWSHAWPGAGRVFRSFLLTTMLNVAGVSASCLLVLGLHQAEPALFFLVFSLVFAFFIALLPPKPRDGSERQFLVPPAGSAGWGALGALLVTLGVAVVLGSALLGTGLENTIYDAARVDRTAAGELSFQRLVDSRLHLLAGLGLFLPGVLSCLRSRQGLGAAHVLRGAFGLAAAGALVYLLGLVLNQGISAEPGGPVHFRTVNFAWLLLLFALGVLTALLLFWPGRNLRVE
jgi:hypothetical protein